VTVVTVVFGDRWNLLRQVADAVLSDSKVTTFVIVDNGCADAVAMDEYASRCGDRVVILRQTRNIGYSGAISKGLAYARDTDCEFVFVLDDDSVPEEGAIDYFLENLKFFSSRKVVLTGNRVDVPGNEKVFYRQPNRNHLPKGTIFEVFGFRKILNLARLLLRIPKPADGPFLPMVPTQAFVTGGSFIPIEAVREAPLPDSSLFIYGEDLEYSWRIRRLGYECYTCARPIINDIDLTFSREGDHIFDLFSPSFRSYKVYFRIRNAVIISRRNTTQTAPVLLVNVLLWTFGLLCIGLVTAGFSRIYPERARLIVRAVRDGYGESRTPPAYLKIPG
jgi:GT2 family glycosyltransferase